MRNGKDYFFNSSDDNFQEVMRDKQSIWLNCPRHRMAQQGFIYNVQLPCVMDTLFDYTTIQTAFILMKLFI